MIKKLDNIERILEKHRTESMAKRNSPATTKDVVSGALKEIADKINEIIDVVNKILRVKV